MARKVKEGESLDLTLPGRKRSSTVQLPVLVQERGFGAELSSGGVRWVPRSDQTLWHRGREAAHGLDQGVFFSWRFLKIQLGSLIQICDPDICCPYHRMKRC